MVTFLEDGGYSIGSQIYREAGTGKRLCPKLIIIGLIFLAPSPTRTRLSLFVDGVDKDGILKAAWSVPFRSGLSVPDYLILGPRYGDPSTSWTGTLLGVKTTGDGDILAVGYWNNQWGYNERCGYLK